jgi:hypothetical protein
VSLSARGRLGVRTSVSDRTWMIGSGPMRPGAAPTMNAKPSKTGVTCGSTSS